MNGQTLLILFNLTLLIGCSSAAHCDRATTAQAQEGNLGQSADFKWLGVLEVQLREWDKDHVAISGIVLIRMKYALANADDVARIPPNIFKMNSKAMFLASRNTPRYAKPASYVTHPEYANSTLNTIAVVKLNFDDTDDFPLTPICLPTPDTFSASSYLYLMGFTDDNEILEKIIYKIQYADNTLCEEFYNRTVSPVQLTPSAYLCGYAPNSVTQCIWENGMVLVSNATGSYDLIGFGIYGPGCAAPARFIDLFPYFSWINFVTGPDEVRDDGFTSRRMEEAKKFIPIVPIQELYTKKGSRRQNDRINDDFDRYPFDVDALKFHLIIPSPRDAHTLLIIPFIDTWQEYEGACSAPAVLMYKEYFQMKGQPHFEGTAIYKLSLYDKTYGTCSCVRLNIQCKERLGAVLSFKEEINFKENIELADDRSWETPKEIFKEFPTYERTEKPKDINELLLEPRFIEDEEIFPKKVMNYDLYIKFEFTTRALMKFEMFAMPFNSSAGWVLPTRKPTTTTMKPKTTTTKPKTTTTKPKTTKMPPKTTTMTPKTKTTKPKITTMTPKTKTTKPKITTMTPKTTTMTPKTKTTKPKITTMTPKTKTTKPKITTMTPKTTTMTPKTKTTKPKITTMTPKTKTTKPKITTMTPKTKTNHSSGGNSSGGINNYKRAESRVKERPRSHWGMVDWADKMLKEAQVSVVANVEEVQETESAARSKGPPGAVVVVCWLVSACLRRAFFVY